ncbi:ATP synthase subunit I [Luteitalea sp.]
MTARLERDTAIVLGLSAVAGAALGGRRLAGGVLGGGLLLAISYRALKRGVSALGPPVAGEEARPAVSAGRVALGLIGRYALLLVAGYVIIGRLHLHPLGVLVGVSAVVVAAMVEAVRSRR